MGTLIMHCNCVSNIERPTHTKWTVGDITACPMKVSWVRRRDVVVLSHGDTVFTSDRRVSVSTYTTNTDTPGQVRIRKKITLQLL